MTLHSTTLAVALALGLAGAGSAMADPGHSPGKKNSAAYDGHAAALGEPGDPKVAKRTIEISGHDQMRFTPATLSISRGETVRFVFKNAGQLKHEIMLGTQKELNEHAVQMEKHPDMEHENPNGTTSEPGGSSEFVWKFTKAGQFFFGCLLPGHYQQGMKGNIIVR